MKRRVIQTLWGVSFSFLTGCQLLTPYKGPVTPTPDSWKTSYNAPDAGEPTIPSGWKDDPSQQPPSLPLEDPYPEIASEPSQGQDIQDDQLLDKEPAMPTIEDLRRDLGDWWKVFHDPILDELEEQALQSSYTLQAALERVIQARSQAAMQYSPLFPNLAFAPNFSRSGSLFQNPYFTGSSGSGGAGKLPKSPADFAKLLKEAKKSGGSSSSAALPSDFRFIQSQYLFPLSMSYEVDLWGQLHNAFYASINKAQASYQDYLGVLLSLTADVASAYFQVRSLDAQQEVIQGNIKVRQHAVNLTKARFKSGLVIYLDVSRAVVELARAHSDSDDVRRQRGLQENQLATLVGVPASVFSIEYNPIKVPPPVIPRGLPSELLSRRPDVAQAERSLAATYRQLGVAYANFFPSFNLNTTIGIESPFAHQLFNWHSRLWDVGWQFVQTVFDAGYNEANYLYYQSIYRETMANYQETTLQAFKDVEDALVNLNGYAKQAQDLAIAVKYARLTLELAQMRYNRGLTNYLDVVDAERQMLETEQTAVIVLGSRYISTVMLIRALGGGWGSESIEEGQIQEEQPCFSLAG